MKPSTGFGKGFVAPQFRNKPAAQSSNRTPARTILVKSQANKQRDEEKVKEFFKDNAIKRMLEEKRRQDKEAQIQAEERAKARNANNPVEYVFNVGERVFHDKLGVGHIEDVSYIGDSVMYTIDFGKMGRKAMDAAYAKLKKF